MANFIKKVSQITPSWSEGDNLVFLPNVEDKTSVENFILTGFEDSVTFTVNGSSRFDRPALSSYDNIPQVINLSRNVNIKGFDSNNRGSIRFIKGANVSINNAIFTNVGTLTSDLNSGIVLNTNNKANVVLNNNTFIGDEHKKCNFLSNVSGGSIENVTISDNIFYNTNINSIKLKDSTANNILIKDNIILSAGNYGIYCENLTSNNVQIIDNTVIHSNSHGIYIVNSENLSGSLSAHGSGCIAINNNGDGLVLSSVQTKNFYLKNVISRGNGLLGLRAIFPKLTSFTFEGVSAINNRGGMTFSLISNTLPLSTGASQLSSGNLIDINSSSNQAHGIYFADNTNVNLLSSGKITYNNCIFNKNGINGIFFDSTNDRIINYFNLTASNNKRAGICLSGDNLNYLSPLVVEANNLVLNNNDTGLDISNVAISLSGAEISNNTRYGIRLFNAPNRQTSIHGLTCLNSTITGAILNGSPVVSLSSPFNNSGGSLKFDGTSYANYLTKSFPLSNVDFTVECWVLPTHEPSADDTTILSLGNRYYGTENHFATNMNGIEIRISQNTDGNGLGFVIPPGYNFVHRGYYLPVGKWTHLALVKNGSNTSLYVDGVSAMGRIGTWNTTEYLDLAVGGDGRLDTGNFKGFISNIKVATSAVPAYQGTSFRVPSAAPVNTIGTRYLINSPYPNYTSNYTTKVSLCSPFNNADGSLYFNGTTDFLRTDDNTAFEYPEYNNIVDFNHNTTCTVEMWVYPEAFAPSTPTNTIMPLIGDCFPDYKEALWVMGLDKDGYPTMKWMTQDQNPASPSYQYGSANVPLNLAEWNHLAYQLDNGYFRVYVNGELTSTRGSVSAWNTVPYNNPSTGAIVNHGIRTLSSYGHLTIGKHDNQYFRGYLSNIRVIKDTRMYNENFIGNLPNKPFDLVAGTSLLFQYPYNYFTYTKNVANLAILSGTNYDPFIISNSYLTNSSDIKPNISTGGGRSIVLDSTRMNKFSIVNSTISSYYGDISLSANSHLVEGTYLFNNCGLGMFPVENIKNYQSSTFKSTGLVYSNYFGTSGSQITYLANGMRSLDYNIFISRITRPSERLTPSSSTDKLNSGSKFVALQNGQTTTIKVFVRKSTLATDGVDYNGNNPRLMLRKNVAAGINEDIKLAEWDEYTDLFTSKEVGSPVMKYNGVFEFYVDCDGTNGFINVDNWTSK